MYVIKFKNRQEVSNWLMNNPHSKTILTTHLEENLLINTSKQENIIDYLENVNLSTLGTFYHYATRLPISNILKYNGLKSMLLRNVDLHIKNSILNFSNRLIIYSQKCIECKNLPVC